MHDCPPDKLSLPLWPSVSETIGSAVLISHTPSTIPPAWFLNDLILIHRGLTTILPEAEPIDSSPPIHIFQDRMVEALIHPPICK